MFLTTAIVAVLLAVIYFGTGTSKLLETKFAQQEGEHLGVSPRLGRIIGALEVSAAVGLLVGLAFWPLGVAAGAGIFLLMIGAVLFRVRAHDKAAKIVPDIVLILLAVAEIILRTTSS